MKCKCNQISPDSVNESVEIINRANAQTEQTMTSVQLSAKQVCFLAALIDECSPESLVSSLGTVFETACFLASVDWAQDGREDLYSVWRLLNTLGLLV